MILAGEVWSTVGKLLLVAAVVMPLAFFGGLWLTTVGQLILLVAVGVTWLVVDRCFRYTMFLQLAGWIVYLLAVAAVANRIAGKAKDDPYLNGRNVSYITNRTLAKNTRLSRADWRKPRNLPPGYFWLLPDEELIEGKYLKAILPADNDIDTDQLADAPDVDAGATYVPVTDVNIAKVLNAGSRVQLCATDTDCVTEPIQVEATVWNADQCYAALKLDNDQKQLFAGKHRTIRLMSLR